jgi:hypothetical protein
VTPSWIEALDLPGFSSSANRRLLNQAVATVPQARILEVGSYIHMIDNHSEFGDTRAELQATCERFGLPATIHDRDWFAPLPADTFGGTQFSVYLYDGPHEEEHHARELAIAWPHLADAFVYIVDDYSWEKVHRGCDAGMLALGGRMNVVSRNVYPSDRLNDAAGYWNGLLVAWCEKT